MYRISYTRVFAGFAPGVGSSPDVAVETQLYRETKEVVLKEIEEVSRLSFPSRYSSHIHPETARELIEAPPGPERILEVNSAEWVIVHKIEGANFVEL